MKNLLTLKFTFVGALSMLIGVTGCSQSISAVSVMDRDRRVRIDHFFPVDRAVQLETPESTAKGLFSAWQENSKASAAKYATKKAIDYLFDLSNSRDKYEFENCSKDSGAVHCWFRNDDGGSLNLTMIKTGNLWKVRSMEFVDIS